MGDRPFLREHGHADGSARLLLVPVLVLAALLVLAGCTFIVDADGETGHACEGETEKCLPGYGCLDGVCVRDPSSGVILCDGSCPSGQKCDMRIGECVDLCSASICPTGWGCEQGGSCNPISSGIGKPCTADADCAGAISGCSVDSDDPGRVLCACFKPAGRDTGVCLGVPSFGDDCAACGEGARCAEFSFSYSGTTLMCVPGGFRDCAEGQAHCADRDHETWCTTFAWPGDPGNYRPGEAPPQVIGLGVMAACATAPESANLEPGETCQAGQENKCLTGLCLPSGARNVCSHPCRRDHLCREIADARCVLAPLDVAYGGVSIFETARVCGTSPTLGRMCASTGYDPACGTDAPTCAIGPEDRHVCTRSCRGDADCAPAQGFECSHSRAACF